MRSRHVILEQAELHCIAFSSRQMQYYISVLWALFHVYQIKNLEFISAVIDMVECIPTTSAESWAMHFIGLI